MLQWIKSLFRRCDHEWKFVRNIYGDEINHVSLSTVYRSWWRCEKCGKIEPRRGLFDD